MAIHLKSPWEVERMAKAGALLTEVFELIAAAVKPGVTTLELDTLAQREIEKRKAKPAFLGLYGFPNTILTSVNDVVVHGIPNKTPLQDGDIVSIDGGLILDGYAADMARTYAVGSVSAEAQRLIKLTEESFWVGLKAMQVGNRIGDIGHAVQSFLEGQHNLWCIREMVGHGIGRKIHEDPQLPNFGQAGTGPKLRPGMTLAFEPMVALYPCNLVILSDGWTATAGKGNLAAHYENTVLITEDGPQLLTGDPARAPRVSV